MNARIKTTKIKEQKIATKSVSRGSASPIASTIIRTGNWRAYVFLY